MGSLVTMAAPDMQFSAIRLFNVLQLYRTSYAVRSAFLATAGLVHERCYYVLFCNFQPVALNAIGYNFPVQLEMYNVW